MPRQQRLHSLRQDRDYDAWETQYIHDNQWKEYTQADRMWTDGPRILRGLATSTIVLSPTIQRYVSTTLVKKFFWLNGKLRVYFHMFPSSVNPGNVEITLSVYAFKLTDVNPGAALQTLTENLTLTSDGLHTMIFQMEDVVIEDPHVIVGLTFDHDPSAIGNTYPDKLYVPGCEVEYQSLVRQQ